jgi:ribosomal protein S18 acetylase RimI-like enzyme
VTLPEPILSFWIASLELHAGFRPTPWGAIVTDARYPGVYEANHASVLRLAPQLTVEDIRVELLPALEEAGATNEHIEIMDENDESPALQELLASPGEHDPDVVMVYEGGDSLRAWSASREVPEAIRVEEVLQPDMSFWSLYRSVPNEYGEELPDEVLDQMLARVQELFVPAGERFFVATIEGTIAGMVSMFTLEGVAYIDNVVTLPRFRGRGVATAAVTRAVLASQEAGAELLFLLAEEGRTAQRLYERLGFVVRRRCYGFTRPLHGAISGG